MSVHRHLTNSPAYQVVMLVLCLYAIGSLAFHAVRPLHPEVTILLDYADNAVCVLFFLDFAISFWMAPNRLNYLLRWGWLDLLSSIPMLDVARWGRMGRILRIFRVLRALRAAKLLTTVVLKHRAQNAFLAAGLAALLLVIFCSIAVLHFESDPQANIKTAEDAIWWAFVTVTTVGYGDRFPVTPEGRFIAALLMCAGVGLFGTLSGLLAAWFLAPEESAMETEIGELRKEIRALREALDRQSPNA
jgi:voltage-gated potassium channel